MGKKQYTYDKDGINFRRTAYTKWGIIGRILKYFLASVSLAVVYYLVFALLVSTDKERKLKNENRMFEKVYPEMERKEDLLSDVVSGLQVRDDEIYQGIFHSATPSVGRISSEDFIAGSDSLPNADVILYTAGKIDALRYEAASVEDNFLKIFGMLASGEATIPPMSLPLENFHYSQTGASVGKKINPFYKVDVNHNGLDLVAPSGTPVFAAADGIITEVKRSGRGLGNIVVIGHKGGYSTTYAHLSSIIVAKGRKISKGNKLGYVGVSGNSFAPHLHYELMRDTVVLDPVNSFFASLTSEEYLNMLYMSAATGQSLD